jgi:nucleoside diphosphate kinase
MEHYKHLKDKPYYPTMIKYMSSGEGLDLKILTLKNILSYI